MVTMAIAAAAVLRQRGCGWYCQMDHCGIIRRIRNKNMFSYRGSRIRFLLPLFVLIVKADGIL